MLIFLRTQYLRPFWVEKKGKETRRRRREKKKSNKTSISPAASSSYFLLLFLSFNLLYFAEFYVRAEHTLKPTFIVVGWASFSLQLISHTSLNWKSTFKRQGRFRQLGYETLFSSFLPLGKLNPVRIWFGDVAAAAAGDQSGKSAQIGFCFCQKIRLLLLLERKCTVFEKWAKRSELWCKMRRFREFSTNMKWRLLCR